MKSEILLDQERFKTLVPTMTYKNLYARSALPDCVEFCLTLPTYATADLSLDGQLFHANHLNKLTGDQASLLVATIQKGTLEVTGTSFFATLQTGDVFLLDFAHPYQLRGSRCRLHCLMIQQAPQEELIAGLLEKTPVTLRRSEGITLMLHQQLAGLRDCLRLTSMEDAKDFLPPLLNLVDHTVQRACAVQNGAESTNLVRIRTFIEEHLSRPELSADMIAKSLGLSRASLYRLAEPLGGIQKFITGERLKKAYRLLAHTRGKSSITNLAFDLGFNTETAFRRSFKDKYGITPTKVRAQSNR